MTWGITPVEFTPPSSDAFPDFLQWQNEGDNLGDTSVDTVNCVDGINATRGVGEDANVITLSAVVTPHVLTWRYIDGDGIVEEDDVDNGIVMLANTGTAVLTVPQGVIANGRAVLVLQKGAATVDIVPGSGLDLVYPTARFLAALAGEGAIVTLLAGPSDSEMVLCGDMASLP